MPAAEPASDLDFCKSLCRDVADMSLEIARALRDRIVPTEHAAPPAPDAHLPALAKAFDGVSAGIRRTVLLIERLAQPRAVPNPDRLAARKRVLRTVEDEIARAPLEPEHAERLTGELHERLETLEFEDDLDDRPAGEIIQDIIHDLGLGPAFPSIFGATPRWKRRTPAEVAALAARAANTLAARAGLPANDTPPEREYRLLATPNPT